MKSVKHIHGVEDTNQSQAHDDNDLPKEGSLPKGDDWLEDFDNTFGSDGTYGKKAALKILAQDVPLSVPKGETTFFKCHEDSKQVPAYIYSPEGKLGKEVFVIAPPFVPHFPGHLTQIQLIPFITMGNRIGVWPLRLENKRGERDNWTETAWAAYQAALTKWINLGVGKDGYVIGEAETQDTGEIVWPLSPKEMRKLAMKGKVIDDATHPVVMALLGRR